MAFETDNIEKIFHYSTEHKDDDEAKREKNNRRFETICRKLPEVMHVVYESKNGIIASIGIVNERYTQILSQEDIANAIKELQSFYKIISNHHIDIHTKASIISSFDFKEYRKLVNTCKFSGLKSVSRLTNMKTMSINYLHGKFDKKLYSEDLKLQSFFFNNLISKYKDMSIDNFYVYVLRYDLKTIKSRIPVIRTKK
ncbi:MAG: hypothetical protein PHD15_05040 [Clostridia bacterium]|nr:hypothetical protein [Clostridia bacterium]MDD4387099.1 hypothetical protein [Clostridia bacterium]